MKKKNEEDGLVHEIIEDFGTLDEKGTKAFHLSTWGDHEPKFDIRKQYTTKKSDEIKYGSGISLTEDEMDALVEKYKKYKKSKPKAVDFKEIFDSSTGIMEKRKKGYTTKDGCIVLRPKK